MSTPPDVYAYAAALAGRMGVRVVEWDLARPAPSPIPDETARDAVVVCSDVLGPVTDPAPLVRDLARLAERTRAMVVSTRDEEVVRMFAAHDASPALAGLTRDDDHGSGKHTILLAFGRELERPSQPAPAGFSVLAVMPAYNEVDIIGPVVERLLAQGVHVHVIDNWSTDGTFERVAELAAGDDRVSVERFPEDGAPERCEWASVVHRVERVAAESEADWIVFQDADEIRRAPWPGIGLRDGIWAVDRAGYTLVDHTVVNFRPVDLSGYPGTDPLAHFTHFEFGQHPGDFHQLKTWKRSPDVTFAGLGGHRAQFEDARIYPLKFTNLHFPIRSHAHGRRKILDERRERFSAADRARGWHSHYDFVDAEATLVWDADQLHPYDAATFEREFLTELVTGVNIARVGGDPTVYGPFMKSRLLRR